VLEALASGLPVVASKIPGITDLVIDGFNGKLIDINNINLFIDAILHYFELWYKEPQEYKNLRNKIRQNTIAYYDWNIIVDRIEKMFIETSQEYTV